MMKSVFILNARMPVAVACSILRAVGAFDESCCKIETSHVRMSGVSSKNRHKGVW
jgi:hypothetical protein